MRFILIVVIVWTIRYMVEKTKVRRYRDRLPYPAPERLGSAVERPEL